MRPRTKKKVAEKLAGLNYPVYLPLVNKARLHNGTKIVTSFPMIPGYRIIITGGAGFIGSAVARHIIHGTPNAVCVVDKLTYAGNLKNFAPIAKSDRYIINKELYKVFIKCVS